MEFTRRQKDSIERVKEQAYQRFKELNNTHGMEMEAYGSLLSLRDTLAGEQVDMSNPEHMHVMLVCMSIFGGYLQDQGGRDGERCLELAALFQLWLVMAGVDLPSLVEAGP